MNRIPESRPSGRTPRVLKTAVAIAIATVAVGLAACGGAPSKPAAGTGGTAATAAGTKTITVKLFVPEVPRGIGPSIEKGQAVKVKSTGVTIGTVVSVETSPSALANPNASGELVESASPLTDDLLITIEGQAAVSETGYRIGSGNIYVNSQDEYLTPTTIVKGTIISIETGS